MKYKVLVFGATGQQGFATVSQLIDSQYNVRAFTRDSNSEKSKELKSLGAEIFQGNLDNESDLRNAIQDIDGVFLVLPPEWNPTSASDEKEWLTAKLIIDIAMQNNLKHLVYSSVMGSELQESFRPLFKYTIEQYLQNSGLAFTILKPAVFYENFYMPQYGLGEGRIYNPLPADMKLPFISVKDIGVFARLALEKPDVYAGKVLNITGELLTAGELAEIFTEKLGVEITPIEVPLEILQAQNELLGKFMKALHQEGYPSITVEELKVLNPELLSLRHWIDTYASANLKKIVK